MATERTAAEITRRFKEEQEYIRRYVELLESRLTVRSSDVWDVRGVLQSWGLVPAGERLKQERNPPELTTADIVKDVAALTRIEPTIDQAIREQLVLLNRLLPDDESPLVTPEESEWIEYLEKHYADALLTMDHEEVLGQCIRQHEWQCADAEKPLDQDMVKHAIKQATGLRAIRKYQALQHAKNGLKEMQLLLRVARPEAEINMLRQGFILLMTAFDAAIFDLARVALRRKFFALVGAFGKQDKLSLQEIGERGSWEAIRDEIIEEQLKKRYVKDLLGLLAKEWGVECVDKSGGDKFERLIELVLRRNLHVHNRGVADQRYIDDMNLDRLKIGDLAVIDQPYWDMANRLCEGCVERVAAWAAA